jgi:hypothetical protein
MKMSTPPVGVPKYTHWKRMQWAIRYRLACAAWRIADWLIKHAPQRMERIDHAAKIEVYLLLNDSRSKWGMDQMTWELNAQQWTELDSMDGIILAIEMTDKTGNRRMLEAHFYDRQDSPACVRRRISYNPFSDAHHPPDRRPNSIQRRLFRLLSRKHRTANDPGSYPKSDTTTNGGVQSISQQTT